MDGYLPVDGEWDSILKSWKVKDNGLGKAITAFRKARGDEFDKRIAALTDISRLAPPFLKIKEFKADPKMVKYINNIITVAPKWKKQDEEKKEEADKLGRRKVKIQIVVTNWDGYPLDKYTGIAEFKSPGAPVVKVTDDIDGGVMDIDELDIMPSGTLHFIAIKTRDTDVKIEGATKYDAPMKGVMTFKANQNSRPVTQRAKTIEEATKKLGLKGTIGVEYKLISASGEVSEETETKHGEEHEIEFQGAAGLPSFKDFAQA
jgi:hypothetical protein